MLINLSGKKFGLYSNNVTNIIHVHSLLICHTIKLNMKRLLYYNNEFARL